MEYIKQYFKWEKVHFNPFMTEPVIIKKPLAYGFYMITASAMKGLNIITNLSFSILSNNYNWKKMHAN